MSRSKIQEQWADSDGYWIVLRAGYCVDGVHAVVEETRAKARARMADVKPCECADCKPTKEMSP